MIFSFSGKSSKSAATVRLGGIDANCAAHVLSLVFENMLVIYEGGIQIMSMWLLFLFQRVSADCQKYTNN